MLETGYDDVRADHKLALQNYKVAFNHGNSDALINIAVFYLNDRYVSRDQKVGQALLKKAYQLRNARAIDCMIQYGLITDRTKLEGFLQEMGLREDARMSQISMLSQSRTDQTGLQDTRTNVEQNLAHLVDFEQDASVNAIMQSIGLNTG